MDASYYEKYCIKILIVACFWTNKHRKRNLKSEVYINKQLSNALLIA